MSKVHYTASNSEEESYSERAMCGVRVGESYQYSNLWGQVSCKLCLKNRSNIEASLRFDNNESARQLGDMADFMVKNNGNN